jgi:hypothetical protein
MPPEDRRRRQRQRVLLAWQKAGAALNLDWPALECRFNGSPAKLLRHAGRKRKYAVMWDPTASGGTAKYAKYAKPESWGGIGLDFSRISSISRWRTFLGVDLGKRSRIDGLGCGGVKTGVTDNGNEPLLPRGQARAELVLD